MVLESSHPPKSRPGSRRGRPRIRSRSNLQRLLISAYNLVSIDLRLLLLETQRSVLKLVSVAIFAVLGAIAGLLGTIFLYIFLFKLLAHALGSLPAMLIFALVHLLVAALLFSYCHRLLNAKAPADEPNLTA